MFNTCWIHKVTNHHACTNRTPYTPGYRYTRVTHLRNIFIFQISWKWKIKILKNTLLRTTRVLAQGYPITLNNKIRRSMFVLYYNLVNYINIYTTYHFTLSPIFIYFLSNRSTKISKSSTKTTDHDGTISSVRHNFKHNAKISF